MCTCLGCNRDVIPTDRKTVKNTKLSCQHVGFLKLIMHQNPFSAGALPVPRWGAYDAPSDSLVGWGGGQPLPLTPTASRPRRLRHLASDPSSSIRLIPTLNLPPHLGLSASPASLHCTQHNTHNSSLSQLADLSFHLLLANNGLTLNILAERDALYTFFLAACHCCSTVRNVAFVVVG